MQSLNIAFTRQTLRERAWEATGNWESEFRTCSRRARDQQAQTRQRYQTSRAKGRLATARFTAVYDQETHDTCVHPNRHPDEGF